MILVFVIGSATLLSASITSVADAACPDGKLLTIRPWYDGLIDQSTCAITSPGSNPSDQKKFFGRILLNIIDGMLQVVGMITIGFIIFGGFRYMTSAGAPDKAAGARLIILHATIGMVIAIASVGLVNFVGAALGI